MFAVPFNAPDDIANLALFLASDDSRLTATQGGHSGSATENR
jgi:hypothetical protein